MTSFCTGGLCERRPLTIVGPLCSPDYSFYKEKMFQFGSYHVVAAGGVLSDVPTRCRVLMYLYRATIIPHFGAETASRPMETPSNPGTAAYRTLSWVSTQHRLHQTARVRTALRCDPSLLRR